MTNSHKMTNNHKNLEKRRKKEKLARREAILRAARKVFFKKGFMEATMDEIADRCGLAKGTLYLYFQSKEEIYLSLMIEGMKLIKKELDKVGDLRLRSDEALERLMNLYYDFYRQSKEYFRIIFLSSHPDFRVLVSDGLLKSSIDIGKECLQIVAKVIERGMKDGFFRKVDPWAMANILWVMVNGIIMNYEEDPIYREEIVRIDLNQLLKISLQLILEGLKKRP